MRRYVTHSVTLYRWTDQGLRNVKDTVKRTQAAISAMEKAGEGHSHWTQGQYDMVVIVEGSGDEDAGNAILLGILQAGNVRTETMRAFNAEEMERILKKVP